MTLYAKIVITGVCISYAVGTISVSCALYEGDSNDNDVYLVGFPTVL
jgi:hypothetical protein